MLLFCSDDSVAWIPMTYFLYIIIFPIDWLPNIKYVLFNMNLSEGKHQGEKEALKIGSAANITRSWWTMNDISDEWMNGIFV